MGPPQMNNKRVYTHRTSRSTKVALTVLGLAASAGITLIAVGASGVAGKVPNPIFATATASVVEIKDNVASIQYTDVSSGKPYGYSQPAQTDTKVGDTFIVSYKPNGPVDQTPTLGSETLLGGSSVAMLVIGCVIIAIVILVMVIFNSRLF